MGVRARHLPNGGAPRVLPLVRHASGHERALPGRALRGVRVGADAAQPRAALLARGARAGRRRRGRVGRRRHHAARRLQDRAQHAGECECGRGERANGCRPRPRLQEPDPPRLQEAAARVDSLRGAAGCVLRASGPRGFFKGLQARVLYQMPAAAICWLTYESLKHALATVSTERESLY